MSSTVFVAVDLGASSGRHVAGAFDGSRLSLAELYRFENAPVPMAGRLYWDLPHQWSHVVQGMRAAASAHGDRIRSIGIDTWGVDFGLLGHGDELLGNPYNYRDPRTDGMLERAFAIVPRGEIFAQTGIQFMQINTLYQLLAMRLANSPVLAAATDFLMVPDLFHWLLTGVKANELTMATTTQFFDPRTGAWATSLLERFGIPTQILGRIVKPGQTLGRIRAQVAAATHLSNVEVVVPGTHDTASAVMAVPAISDVSSKQEKAPGSAGGSRPNWCYISSGTWSLMGVEIARPIIDDKCLALNFTNEGGVGGTTRLLKNICGLWLVQECRRVWSEAGTRYSWEYLTQQAAEAKPLRSFVNPDDPRFLAPADMPETIRDYCCQTGQHVPHGEGEIIRCALESLALKYRVVLGWLEELTGGRIDTVHIVGGGAQNRQLCQMAADACNRRVIAGPVEATAIGNLMMQTIAAGEVGSIAEAREVVRRSFSVETYEPRDAAAWEEAYQFFAGLRR